MSGNSHYRVPVRPPNRALLPPAIASCTSPERIKQPSKFDMCLNALRKASCIASLGASGSPRMPSASDKHSSCADESTLQKPRDSLLEPRLPTQHLGPRLHPRRGGTTPPVIGWASTAKRCNFSDPKAGGSSKSGTTPSPFGVRSQNWSTPSLLHIPEFVHP